MKTSPPQTVLPYSNRHARATIILLVLVVFLLGLAAGSFWFRRTLNSADAGDQKEIVLSEATKSVLGNLKSPVEIRFYSLLKDSGVNESLGAFSSRAGGLISEYEHQAGGKVHVVSISSATDAEMDAASADGIAPFNREKGDVCYLGVAVSQSGRRESIPQLLPEWEAALESDLTRAIERVSKPRATQTLSTGATEVTPAATADLKRYIPDLESISLEQGTAKLFEAARIEFEKAAADSGTQVAEAEAAYANAVSGGKSEAEQLAAREQLQKAKEQQAGLFKEISARFRARVDALDQLKSGSH